MKNLLLFFCLVAFSINLTAQRWTYEEGGNSFDGKYRASYVKGTGAEFPYNKPILVVNKFDEQSNINIYIKGCGYAGCDNKKIYLKFDKEDQIYQIWASTNKENDTWFFDFGYSDITKVEFLEKVKQYGTLDIRVSNDCTQNDLSFSLSGSSKALDFVLPSNYFEDARQKELSFIIEMGDDYLAKRDFDKAKEMYEQALRLDADNMDVQRRIEFFDIKPSDTLVADTRDDAMVYTKDDYDILLTTNYSIPAGGKVIITGFDTNDKLKNFSKLISSKVVKSDTIAYYLRNKSIDILGIKKVDD